MKAFVIRLRDDKALMGIVIARNRNELADIIDEYADPTGCEYANLTEGGILWSGVLNPPTVPLADENVAESWFDGAHLSERWGDSMTGLSHLRWMAMCKPGETYFPGIGFFKARKVVP